MQESNGSIDIKEERKDNPDNNVVVMPVEESTNLLTMPQRIKKSSRLNVPLSKKRKLIQLKQDEKSDESQIVSGNRVTTKSSPVCPASVSLPVQKNQSTLSLHARLIGSSIVCGLLFFEFHCSPASKLTPSDLK